MCAMVNGAEAPFTRWANIENNKDQVKPPIQTMLGGRRRCGGMPKPGTPGLWVPEKQVHNTNGGKREGEEENEEEEEAASHNPSWKILKIFYIVKHCPCTCITWKQASTHTLTHTKKTKQTNTHKHTHTHTHTQTHTHTHTHTHRHTHTHSHSLTHHWRRCNGLRLLLGNQCCSSGSGGSGSVGRLVGKVLRAWVSDEGYSIREKKKA